jgi:DNA polymerase-3 subunit epsilon
VFHTASVEEGFMAARGVRLRTAADTEALGRLWVRSRLGEAPARLPLTTLAARLGQPAEPPHHALGDALTTAQVFIALATLLEQHGDAQTVGSLVFAGDRLRGARRFGAT